MSIEPGSLIHVVVAATAASGLLSSSLGMSAIRASEVRSSADAGRVLKGVRVTLVGSMMPALTRSVYSSEGVVAEVCPRFRDLADDDAAVLAGVLGDLVERRQQARTMMLKPISSSCVRPLVLSPSEERSRRDAAAGKDAFLEGRAGGVQGVLDAGLLLLHLALGRGADVDLGDAAGQLGQPFFELLAVVVALGVGDLAADRLDPALDRRRGCRRPR